MNTQQQTVPIGIQPTTNHTDHPGSNRVYPLQPRSSASTARRRCPCSVDFKGETTCKKAFIFFLCLILMAAYLAMMVMGAVQFGRCEVHLPETYLITQGIACSLLVLIFACWLCNRCCDAKAVVIAIVLFLTAITLWSLIGALWIGLIQCDDLTRYAAIGFSCPIWLVIVIVCLFWINTNYVCITIGDKTHCFQYEEIECCPCCDCSAGADRLLETVD